MKYWYNSVSDVQTEMRNVLVESKNKKTHWIIIRLSLYDFKFELKIWFIVTYLFFDLMSASLTFIGSWRQVFPVHPTPAPVAASAQASVWGGSLLASWPAHRYERKQDSIWLRRQSLCEFHPSSNVFNVKYFTLLSSIHKLFLINSTRNLAHTFSLSLGLKFVKLVKRVRLGSVGKKVGLMHLPFVPTLPRPCIFIIFCKWCWLRK